MHFITLRLAEGFESFNIINRIFMLKIIHCADIHLGSKMEARLPREKVLERRQEVRATFGRMLEFARKEKVRAIILAGDVFDSDRPLKKDKEFFYTAVRSFPEIDFLYLRGNHGGGGAYTETPENLKTFSDKWQTYSYGEADITGLEINPGNALSMYSTLELKQERLNIVTLHGQVGDGSGADKVNIKTLKNKNIDYLALGHVHSRSENKLDDRGRYAYSGCLEGRGFDETGEKGFVLLEIDGKINTKFVPFAVRKIEEVCVDITGAENPYDAYLKIKPHIGCGKKDMVRVILKGETDMDGETLGGEVENYLSREYYFVSVKVHTRRRYDIARYEGDITLKGEFIKTVLECSGYSDEEKQQIISFGIKALTGGEVE